MTCFTHRLALALALAASLLVAVPLHAEDPPKPDDIAAMMAAARKYTEPGKSHQALNPFVGKWSTQTRFFMGGQASPPESGTSEFSWLMPGRWLVGRGQGRMMGMGVETYVILGYDNFKQSYVMTTMSSMDTAMNHYEGDMDPGGKAIIMYGTLDEYLTGENDKMVKYVWRFPSADSMVLEVHDLPIGEANTKVIEIAYTRQPAP